MVYVWCAVCLFDSCISIPLHGARRAMAAAPPLPPAGRRRHFRGISARPGPACAVIVGVPPSAQKQKRKTKEKAHDAPRRKQKKTNCRPPPAPYSSTTTSGATADSNSTSTLPPSAAGATGTAVTGASGALAPRSLRGGDGDLHPLAACRASLFALHTSTRAP